MLPLSETHYSLKEMETITSFYGNSLKSTSSETHYSLKEMETTFASFQCQRLSLSVGNPLLSERDGNLSLYLYYLRQVNLCRKPTTL